MEVTIKDVAARAGVSISTVSRVLNAKGLVAPEKEIRVLEAVEELQFVPNAVAQSLRSKRTKMIGLLVGSFDVPFFGGILRILENGLQNSYQIISGNVYEDGEKESLLIENLVRSRVDMLIVNPTGLNDRRLYEIQCSGIPVLSYDRHPADRKFPSVYVDKKQGVYQLLDYFYQLGHRRFCFLSGPAQLSTNIDRQAGVLLFKREHPDVEVQCHYGAYDAEFGCRLFQRTAYGENAPTAYITGSIAIAEGIVLYCTSHRIGIPRDVSLASFGTFQNDNLIHPTLLHVGDEYAAIGEKLLEWVRMLIDEKPVLSSSEHVIPSRLILGESAAPPRKGVLEKS